MTARFLPLLVFLFATFGAAALGSFATFRTVGTWYPSLVKPSWTPPAAIFGPVWSVLYCAMAIAGWRVWRRTEARARRNVTVLYGAQLGLNALWSVLFFGLRRPDLALIDIAVLWTVLVALLLRYWHTDRVAGALWTPYVAWVSFASALNAAIWHLNR
jgi:benzodiazapine receptor